MGGKTKKILIGGLLVMFVSLSGYLGWLSWQMKKTIEIQQSDIHQLNRQKRGLKKKYAAEKARSAAIQRTKLAVEAQKRAVEADLATVRAEQAELRKTWNDYKLEVTRKFESYEAEQARLAKRIQGLQADRRQLQARLKKTAGDLAARETAVERLNSQNSELQADLDAKNQEINRNRSHNQKLVALSGELIDRYEKKGTGKILLENEPFLGLKKVEWEHLRQEYEDRIDKHAFVDGDR